MPSSDRRVVVPMPVGGRLRTGVSLLLFGAGLLLFGATVLVHGPPVLFGAALALMVTLGVLGLVGGEPERGRDRTSVPGRREAAATRAEPTPEDDPVEILKRRYAAGEVDDEEFDRRVEQLVALGTLDGADDEREVERARS